MQIKICGITNLEDALLALELGADTLGFIFYPKSARSIQYSQAKEIINKLPQSALLVGVFVEQDPEEIRIIARDLNLSFVQLHGEQNLNKYLNCSVPVIQVLTPKLYVNNLEHESLVLIDSALGKEKVFEKKGKSHLEGRNQSQNISITKSRKRLIISGNLNPNNVEELIRYYRPLAVDVARSIELIPGKKCPIKMELFIKKAKLAFGEIKI